MAFKKTKKRTLQFIWHKQITQNVLKRLTQREKNKTAP